MSSTGVQCKNEMCPLKEALKNQSQ